MSRGDRFRNHPVLLFCLVAFGWTWLWDAVFFAFGLWRTVPVSIPRVWGPAIAALVAVRVSNVRVWTWMRRRLDWRLSPVHVLIAVSVPIFATNIQPVVEAVGGGSLTYDPPARMLLMIVFVSANLLVLGGTEELGWRGVLQPRLQQRFSVFSSGLLIGVLWWSWHLPLFFTQNPNFSLEPLPLLSYTLFVLGASVVFGAFVNFTRGRVLPIMLMHATVNAGAFISATGGLLEGSPLIPLVVGSGLWWGLAAGLVAVYGLSMSPNAQIDPVVPAPNRLDP